MKVSFASAIAAIVAFTTVPAHAAAPRQAKLLEGPPVAEAANPYDGALACLAKQVTPDHRKVVYAVGSFTDKTGKVNIASEAGTGTFVSQGLEDILMTQLKKTGVRVANLSPGFKGNFDWITQRAGGGEIALLVPDVMIQGSVNTFDVGESSGFEFDTPIIAGYRKYRMIVGFDSNVTAMPFATRFFAGEVITTFEYTKQFIGYENKFGVTSFLGGGSTRSLFRINLGKQQNELLQHNSRWMMAVVAFRSVRDVTGITACDDTFRSVGYVPL